MRNGHRATQHAAEIVLAFRSFGLGRGVDKPVVRVQIVIAEVLESETVELVGARTRDHQNLTSRLSAIFRRVCRSFYSELLQRVN